jgi:hypothetical protein
MSSQLNKFMHGPRVAKALAVAQRSQAIISTS